MYLMYSIDNWLAFAMQQLHIFFSCFRAIYHVCLVGFFDARLMFVRTFFICSSLPSV